MLAELVGEVRRARRRRPPGRGNKSLQWVKIWCAWQNRRLYIALFCALVVIFYWLGPFNPFRQALDERNILDELLEEERRKASITAWWTG